MSEHRIIQLVIPRQTAEKLDALHEYYLIPPEMILQKIMVDRIDDIHDAVLLEPARKERAA